MNAIRWASAMALGLSVAGCSSESSDWKSATAADTSEAYQQYLQQHPTGTNAEQARTHLKQLQEDRDWQSASSTDNRAAYEQFLSQHPDGKWAEEARIRVENFSQGGATGVPAAGASGAPGASGASAAGASAAPAVSASPAAPTPKPTAHAPPSRVASTALGPRHPSAGAHPHLVQLGAFSTQARAESQWKVLQARFPAQFKAMQPRYVAARAKANPLVRLQVSVSSAERARGLCATLRKHSQACVPVTA
jgi:hypothetical protein